MNEQTLVAALHATTVADDQKNAGEFLDQQCDSTIAELSRRRGRTTTSSSDGADWRNLNHLTDGSLQIIVEDPESRRHRIKSLMYRWKFAARRSKFLNKDPWSEFYIHELPVMLAKRYRYSAIRKAWTEDFVEVRLHPEPFARGAMRECYRLKKLSSLGRSDDWKHAQNYVAKKYIQEVERDVLFEDVKLQMDAKLWAEEFNRYDPPKKIDIVQMCIVEMMDMPGQPLYHLEHYIEGEYIKYNSNSGFVSDVARKTPQAFSHFTFERSSHQMIVVDVQGVGDLYTDPQVHTVVGTDYGDGNLGTRGMALFFHSHVCNDICHSLCLTEFDLSDSEKKELEEGSRHSTNPSTMFSRHASACSAIVQELFEDDAMECLRHRSLSIRSRSSSTSGNSHAGSRSSDGRDKSPHDDDCVCEDCLEEAVAGVTFDSLTDDQDDLPEVEDARPPRKVAFHTLSVERKERERHDSMGSSIGTSSLGSSRLTRETEKEEYWTNARKQSIPAGVISAIELQQLAEDNHRITQHISILGQIHLDLARYHELGRFLPEENNELKRAALADTDSVADSSTANEIKYDKQSALYHLDVARRCGVLEAVLTVAQMAYGMPHELLKDIGDDENWNQNCESEDYDREGYAFELMETAAEMGDRSAMLFVAEAYSTGRSMGKNSHPSYPKALDWFQKAVVFSDEDAEGSYRPRYEILAQMAEMYQEGGCGLIQDFERAYNLYNEAAECTKTPGFAPHLLKIACDGNVAPAARQAAVIYFKNTVVKYWELEVEDDAQKQETAGFSLSDADKSVIRNNILDAICIASDTTRPQLCVAAQQIIRTDFPEKWPQLLDGIASKLTTPEAASLHGALLLIYRMCKIYEYKRAKDRQPVIDVMKVLLPIIQNHFNQIIANESEESVAIQKLMFKIFYCCIQYALNLDMITMESMDVWLSLARQVLSRPVPLEVEQIEDPDEKAHMVWWKCKKWAAKIIDRVFERYGAPGQVDAGYADFANHFLQNYAIPLVEVAMHILNDKRQNKYVSDRVLHLSLSFLNTAVSHAHTWKVIKPNAQELITSVMFPLLCHTDEDEEMWEDDVEEYVRFKYDIFEDMHNPAYGAGSLLAAMAKRKDIVQPVLAFTINILSTSKNPREIDGALRMVGELAQHLNKSKKYKKDVEKLLDAYVICRLSDEARFVRARAAWCLKQFSDTHFSNAKILKKAVDTLVQTLCNDHEELPAKVESCLAIESLLDEQDKVHDILKPHVGEVIPRVLELTAKCQIEEVVGVMDNLMEQYIEDVVPVAATIADRMCTLFLDILGSEVAEDRTPALMSIIGTLSNILEVVSEHREIMVQMEGSVLRIIDTIFNTHNIDYYDEILLLMQSLLMVYVSEPMWKVFDMLYHLIKQDSGTIIMFSDVVPVLHLYVVTDTESFLARPDRLNAIIDMCRTVLEDNETGDENQLHAAKLLEILIIQCAGFIDEAIPAIVVIALERLTKPFEDGLNELKHMLLLVVVAALYTNTEKAIMVLKELAPNHPNPLDYVTVTLASMSANFEGIHNRRMAALAWCTLMKLPLDYRPTLIGAEPQTVMSCLLQIFSGLQRALKAQADNRKADNDSDSEEESDDEDDDHRNIDEDLSDGDDNVDEEALDYLTHLAKEHKRVGDGENSEGSDYDDDSLFEEETDTEQFTTRMDEENGPDVFVIFKQAMEEMKARENNLFTSMIGSLAPEQAKILHELDQVCDNHVQAEQSKKLKEAGGFSFNPAAAVPGNFNFGG